jgi:ABC-2 type transport system permease protein
LNGVSVVLILSMSALGGSMVPRYLMSESMQRFGRITFNAWALDGYQNVFWYDAPLSALRTEVIVLLAMAAYLLTVARVFADRWETR